MQKTTKIIQIILPEKIYYYTTYDVNIKIDYHLYRADYIIGALKMRQNASLDADILSMSFINQFFEDYDNGWVRIFNYHIDTKQIDAQPCFFGKIHKVTYDDLVVHLKAVCEKHHFLKDITRQYALKCQARWGDTHCKIDKLQHMQRIKVIHIDDLLIKYQIVSGHTVQLYQPYLEDIYGSRISLVNIDPHNQQFTIEPHQKIFHNQHYNLYAGCFKDKSNCKLYYNINNFMGF